MCTGAHNLDGYIGDDKSKGDSLKKLTEKWERNIRAITATAEIYTQESYDTVARAI